MPKPSFIICGAPKSGTMALYEYMKSHPEVCVSTMKEPCFLTQEQGQMYGDLAVGHLRGGTWSRGWEWYENLFSSNPDAKAFGEATAHYIGTEGTPELIAKHLPDVKLIFILREPVARLYSHYWQERKAGLKLPGFETMVETEHPRFIHYCNISHYKENLDRFTAHIPRERILVLTMEQFKQCRAHHLRRVYEFVGVDPDFAPDNLEETFNQQMLPRFPLVERWMNWWTRPSIVNNIPHSVRGNLSKVKRGISRTNSVRNIYEPMSLDVKESLSSRFRQDVAYVEEWLGESLEAWS